ncbi:MAG: sugar transferase, partial [Mogibacterium sp.]|nr:sugar transferase [Mogibacterium sp.]
QVNGRNHCPLSKKFEYDVKYVDNVTFRGDLEIILETVKKVLVRDGISSETSATMEEFMGTPGNVHNEVTK